MKLTELINPPSAVTLKVGLATIVAAPVRAVAGTVTVIVSVVVIL